MAIIPIGRVAILPGGNIHESTKFGGGNGIGGGDGITDGGTGTGIGEGTKV